MPKNDKLLFIDTETGGLSPKTCSLLSVGLVLWRDKKIIAKKEFLIKSTKECTEEALKINKIDLQKHNFMAMTPVQAVYAIQNWLNQFYSEDERIIVAGHNTQFDMWFIKNLFEEEGKKLNFYYRMVDTASILKFLYFAGKRESSESGSEGAFKEFKIRNSNPHNALADAEATAKLFNKLISL